MDIVIEDVNFQGLDKSCTAFVDILIYSLLCKSISACILNLSSSDNHQDLQKHQKSVFW